MTGRPGRTQSQRGAVLLTVLALVAVMAAVSVSVIEDLRLGIRRAANTQLREQAFWYALGAEEFARDVIRRDWQNEPSKSTLQDRWAQGGVRFPVEGGYLEGVIRDGGNCFNLNSVVQPREDGATEIRERGLVQFRHLLEALEIGRSDIERLSNALVDWIDDDGISRPRGAEDDHYTRLSPPYRTANTLLADISELRAIRGFDEEIYRTLHPYVCALPGSEVSRINVNTLTADKAQLLVMLFGDDLDLADAEAVLRDRPAGGFASEDVFWAKDGFDSIEAGPDIREQVGLKTTYYELDGAVSHYDAYFAVTTLFALKESGRIEMVSRSWGEDG